MSIDISKLELPQRIIHAVLRAKAEKVEQLVIFSKYELIRKLSLTLTDAELLLKTLSTNLAQQSYVTAQELRLGTANHDLFPDYKITTGCAKLDEFLNGGIRSIGITEIAGESASGKTQFCLQLALSVQLPLDLGGLAKGAIFICTESIFPSQRLVEISAKFKKKFGNRVKDIKFTDNVFVTQIGDMDGLRKCLDDSLPKLLSLKNIGIIIIDSIAALVRSEFDHTDNITKSNAIQKIGFTLKNIIHEHKVIVCCINQMTANMSNIQYATGITEDCSMAPALGLTWANMITTRILITRSSKSVQIGRRFIGPCEKIEQPVYSAVRYIDICFSPYLPQRRAQFIVNSVGIQGIDD